MIVLGCIADDFTGASDAASFLVKGGMSVCLYNGIPGAGQLPDDDCRAVVIALKSRTQETKQAVADSLEAARFLLAQGARQLYFKYCSTFDSTPRGNIGPVADALLDLLGAPYTLLCPALPANGRTVEQGRLMVHGVPLDQSHMKNHPLTPMWDSRIEELMRPQSRYHAVNIGIIERETPGRSYVEKSIPCPHYLIPDYQTEQDGAAIAERYHALPLLTGGSGLLEPLARIWSQKVSGKAELPEDGTAGKGLVLAGSCSQATLAQIARYQRLGLPSFKLDPAAMLEGRQNLRDAWDFVLTHKDDADAVLIYSSDTPENVRALQRFGVREVSELLEQTVAELAVRAVKAGYSRIISAGGETSGAITKALGFTSYRIGRSIAPGVPIMVPAENPDIRLVLKSGNFGRDDFFIQALMMTSADERR